DGHVLAQVVPGDLHHAVVGRSPRARRRPLAPRDDDGAGAGQDVGRAVAFGRMIVERGDARDADVTRAGARVVGIASVSAFDDHAPEGYRPADILPGARSVVVAGGEGPTAGAWRSPDNRVMEITGYDLRENVAIHAMA